MKLRDFDLNLLVVLETILVEGSVTRAAQRLNLTQPAVSQALSRARYVFNDSLLVRDGANMRPTARAQALAPLLREALDRIECLLQPDDFDPSQARRDFSILAGDIAEIVILTPLITHIARTAPGCRLVIRSVESRSIDHTVDLAITGGPVPAGPFQIRDLYEEYFVIIARPDHPALHDGLTVEAFSRLPHALVSPTGEGLSGPVDVALEGYGLKRHIALSLTRFAMLPSILMQTDLIAAVPSRFAEKSEVKALCRSWPLPFPSPSLTMRLVWHRAHDADPAHRWLRECLTG